MNIVFFGDSITDAGRCAERGSMVEIGQGFALMVSGELGARYPQQFHFVNTGICGNRVVDLYARIKADLWNRAPDVVSLLIGINDIWGELEFQNGVDPKRFEAVYRMLLNDTLERFPNCKFLLMEPYALLGYGTEKYWEAFHQGISERAAIVRKLAEEYHFPCIDIQAIFEKACSLAPTAYWLPDGVHPTPAGHHLIADAWLKTFYKNFCPYENQQR